MFPAHHRKNPVLLQIWGHIVGDFFFFQVLLSHFVILYYWCASYHADIPDVVTKA